MIATLLEGGLSPIMSRTGAVRSAQNRRSVASAVGCRPVPERLANRPAKPVVPLEGGRESERAAELRAARLRFAAQNDGSRSVYPNESLAGGPPPSVTARGHLGHRGGAK